MTRYGRKAEREGRQAHVPAISEAGIIQHRRQRAFSSEVGAGSREENASEE